jgi:hypothetical protein
MFLATKPVPRRGTVSVCQRPNSKRN